MVDRVRSILVSRRASRSANVVAKVPTDRERQCDGPRAGWPLTGRTGAGRQLPGRTLRPGRRTAGQAAEIPRDLRPADRSLHGHHGRHRRHLHSLLRKGHAARQCCTGCRHRTGRQHHTGHRRPTRVATRCRETHLARCVPARPTRFPARRALSLISLVGIRRFICYNGLLDAVCAVVQTAGKPSDQSFG
jgi:hypothetical protein